ncbi:DASH complex subunit Duo1 [Schizosaccharomyces pombe]|uniref:DASH complex subunit duo1 n=1 Tax=Schizosaccharomyces pombe (strain 972 / ATCC 24843) TaxID=284812 RepID=DUO1_SCHPO|nr:RecName: Full=DASH complex subunit duo1; AltName: Full=Outer kinetochore protein duo1 [Schizosaccharomyces pombe 972h-]
MTSELQQELQILRSFNYTIEKLTDGLSASKEKIKSFETSINNSNRLIQLWSSVLSQTEHTQNLILNSDWKGLSFDNEELERLQHQKMLQIQAEEQRKIELQQEQERLEQERRQKEEAIALQKQQQQRLLRSKDPKVRPARRAASSYVPSRPSHVPRSSSMNVRSRVSMATTSNPNSLRTPSSSFASHRQSAIPKSATSSAPTIPTSNLPSVASSIPNNGLNSSNRKSIISKTSSRLRPPSRVSNVPSVPQHPSTRSRTSTRETTQPPFTTNPSNRSKRTTLR